MSTRPGATGMGTAVAVIAAACLPGSTPASDFDFCDKYASKTVDLYNQNIVLRCLPEDAIVYSLASAMNLCMKFGRDQYLIYFNLREQAIVECRMAAIQEKGALIQGPGVSDLLKEAEEGKPPAATFAKVKLAVDVFAAPGGDGDPIGALAVGDKVVLVGCNDPWCHIANADPGRVPGGEGWVYDAPDYDSLDR